MLGYEVGRRDLEGAREGLCEVAPRYIEPRRLIEEIKLEI